MNKIEVSHLTKDYGSHKGVFDISFEVSEGEVLGFLGPNGAGKTTTIRQLMGFIKPDQGTALVKGLEAFEQAHIIHKTVGYLPGEINFIDNMNGMQFIKFIADFKDMKDLSRAYELIEFFEFNPQGKIKKMSKGMKQKMGLICTFMHDPEIYILDEPTSGLDPLMQNKFVELILSEKEKGKTIFMSSHIFEEVEKTCDRVAIIKDGEIVAIDDIHELTKHNKKTYKITFKNEDDVQSFRQFYEDIDVNYNQITLKTNSINELIQLLQPYDISDIDIQKQSLEELFLQFYGGVHHD